VRKKNIHIQTHTYTPSQMDVVHISSIFVCCLMYVVWCLPFVCVLYDVWCLLPEVCCLMFVVWFVLCDVCSLKCVVCWLFVIVCCWLFVVVFLWLFAVWCVLSVGC
jgi:hypothetical protein